MPDLRNKQQIGAITWRGRVSCAFRGAGYDAGMLNLLALLDAKDVFYAVAGVAFLGLTVLPLLCRDRVLVSVPTIYVAVGALLGWWGLPFISPFTSKLTLAVVEHATELIVIVSIAGAGLSVDRPMGRKSWHHTWMLLGVAMPLTILGLVGLGVWWAGLPLASAVLLGACLAPTDPVLASSVQVDEPTEGEEDDVRVSLTTEAGLNDGLAFPFVYLALAMAAAAGGGGYLAEQGLGQGRWWWSWVGWDVGYRLAAGVIVGWLVGYLLSKFIFGKWGDAQQGGKNAGLVLLAGTFLSYGLTEALDGYGFLAVFVSARASRWFAREAEEGEERYTKMPHHFSDQFEKVLLALLLLWLGGWVGNGALADTRWPEVAVAAALIFLIRPAAGWLSLRPTAGSRLDHWSIASLGIRGLGSVFYLAYAMSHGEFRQIEAVWRIGLWAILISVVVHGIAAPRLMQKLEQQGGRRGGGAVGVRGKAEGKPPICRRSRTHVR